jgi:hypothetical protein
MPRLAGETDCRALGLAALVAGPGQDFDMFVLPAFISPAAIYPSVGGGGVIDTLGKERARPV